MSNSLQLHGLHGACQASLSFTISWSSLKLRSIESLMPSNHLIFCRPLLVLSIFTSIRFFPLCRFFTSGGQKYGGFSFSISPPNEYSKIISFRIDWFVLIIKSKISSWKCMLSVRFAFIQIPKWHYQCLFSNANNVSIWRWIWGQRFFLKKEVN